MSNTDLWNCHLKGAWIWLSVKQMMYQCIVQNNKAYKVEIGGAEQLGVPWKEEPGRLQSMGLQRVGHSLVTEPAHNS